MAAGRPDISEDIKRQVRQRCGFGCVLCGHPLIDYEHMLGWANVPRHVAEEITLLCTSHHREKTNGLLPLDAVTAADRDPYNRREGVSPKYLLHYAGSTLEAEIGSNKFVYSNLVEGEMYAAVVLDNEPCLAVTVQGGQILLRVVAYDQYNQLVLLIHDNEMRVVPDIWDIQFVGHRLTIRQAPGAILLDAEFKPPNRIVISRGVFMRNGIEAWVLPEALYVTNTRELYARNTYADQQCAISLGLGKVKAAVSTRFVSRYPVSRQQIEKQLREDLAAWKGPK